MNKKYTSSLTSERCIWIDRIQWLEHRLCHSLLFESNIWIQLFDLQRIKHINHYCTEKAIHTSMQHKYQNPNRISKMTPTIDCFFSFSILLVSGSFLYSKSFISLSNSLISLEKQPSLCLLNEDKEEIIIKQHEIIHLGWLVHHVQLKPSGTKRPKLLWQE